MVYYGDGRDEVTQLTLQLRKKLIFSIIQKSKVFKCNTLLALYWFSIMLILSKRSFWKYRLLQ